MKSGRIFGFSLLHTLHTFNAFLMVVALRVPHDFGNRLMVSISVLASRIDMIEVEEAKQLQAHGGGSLGCSVAVCFKNSRKTMGHGL